MAEESPSEQSQTCPYPFKAGGRPGGRPRDVCEREIEPRCTGNEEWLAQGQRACFWHCHCECLDKSQEPDVKERLGDEVRRGEWLEGAYLQGARLDDAKLQGARLMDAKLQDAWLYRAKLQDAWLYRANLQGARLWDANLQDARLWDANLQDADLEGANLQGARLMNAKLQGARLERIRLSRETDCKGTEWGDSVEWLERRWPEAADVFRNIGGHYREVSDHDRGEYFYYREMEAHRLLAWDAPPPEKQEERQESRGVRWTWLRRFVGWFVAVWRRVCGIDGIVYPPVSLRASRRILFPQWRWNGLLYSFNKSFWGYGVRPERVLVWMFVVWTLWGRASSWTGLPPGGFAKGLVFSLLGGAFVVSLATKYVHRG